MQGLFFFCVPYRLDPLCPYTWLNRSDEPMLKSGEENDARIPSD
jgi:hypothetical protein